MTGSLLPCKLQRDTAFRDLETGFLRQKRATFVREACVLESPKKNVWRQPRR
jgi:hypothetical protein